MKNNLDRYKFSTYTGINADLIERRYKMFRPHFIGKSCLELGCADGLGTGILLNYCTRVVAVDGSRKLLSKLKKKIKSKKLTAICSRFESLKIDETFEVVMMGHILEHVDEPVTLLCYIKQFIKKDGIVIVDVPNAYSIHRQVGVLLHMISEEHALNEADKSIGHKRVYDMNLLKLDVERAGLTIVKEGGVFLKTLSNDQLETICDKQLLEAFEEVGRRYPDVAAEIYIIAKQS